MHQCLRLPEIVENICQQGFHGSARSRNGVLALAQTCRSLYEPAANVIWYRVESLKPLVDCIPAGIWSSMEGGNNTLPTPLQSSDLSRLRLLARRIRVFGPRFEGVMHVPTLAHSSPGKDVKEYQYQALSLANGFAPLLPNVRQVTIINPNAAVLTHVNLFTTSQLKHLQIFTSIQQAKQWQFQFLAFLGSMGERYPLLETLEIYAFPFKDPVTSAIETAVCSCRWDRLSTLILGVGNSTKILQDVLRRPSLKKIVVQVSELYSHAPLSFEQDSRFPGPSPAEIELVVPRFSMLSDFIGLPFSKINIARLALSSWSDDPQTSEQWRELMQTLHDQVNPLNMKALCIEDLRIRDHQEDAGQPFTVDLVNSPLFRFRNLTRIIIRTSGILTLDDQLLRCIVQSWPRIRALQIGGKHPSRPPPKATFEGISLFADNCPDLRALGLEFRADTSVERVSKPLTRPRFGKKLRELDVCNSPIGKPGPVAAFLADLFPCINKFSSNGSTDSTWNEVFELHPVFVKVRLDEIARPL